MHVQTRTQLCMSDLAVGMPMYAEHKCVWGKESGRQTSTETAEHLNLEKKPGDSVFTHMFGILQTCNRAFPADVWATSDHQTFDDG